jgi:trehalose synthase
MLHTSRHDDDMSLRPQGSSDGLIEVEVPARPVTSFASAAEPEQYEHFLAAAAEARELFRGRVVWNLNSTPQGGGVAEMLRPLLGYVRGAGIDARWLVIRGDPAFFRVTKRLHNRLHGEPGDGGVLGPAERDAYRAASEANVRALAPRLNSQDIVILHDPQTAGLTNAIREIGASVVWRSHIGVDQPNDLARNAWEFLAPFVASANAYVFSRAAHVWDVLDRSRVHVIPPSIDVFAPKNYDLEPQAVESILAASGITTDHVGLPPDFVRSDGSPGRVDRQASLVGGPVSSHTPLVVQVSRWDRLKDPAGVIAGFVEYVAPQVTDVHLALVGPEVSGVSDDPEGASVLAEISEQWHRLPTAPRERVHLVILPLADSDMNAVMVNAIQRHATVVVQKSLAEGFGLTVAEAMWKARPVVASAVGGIQDQIESGLSGVLVPPRDHVAYGAATVRLLSDPRGAAEMGQRARDRVRKLFLGPRHLLQYFELVAAL